MLRKNNAEIVFLQCYFSFCSHQCFLNILMPVISEKYIMGIKIISSQPKGVMAQDEKVRFGNKGLLMVSGGSEVEKVK